MKQKKIWPILECRLLRLSEAEIEEVEEKRKGAGLLLSVCVPLGMSGMSGMSYCASLFVSLLAVNQCRLPSQRTMMSSI